MEKVQMETSSALPITVRSGRYQAVSVDSDFSKLLKGQNPADANVKGAKSSDSAIGKTAPDTAKGSVNSAKEENAAEGGKTESEEEEENILLSEGKLPAELLLQLQGALVQMAVQQSQETATAESAAELPLEVTPAEAEAVLSVDSEQPVAGEGVMPAQESLKTDEALPAVETESHVTEVSAQTAETPKNMIVAEKTPEPVNATHDAVSKTQDLSETVSMPADSLSKAAVTTQKQENSRTREESGQDAGTQTPLFTTSGTQYRNDSVAELERTSSAPVKTAEPTLIQDVGHAIASRLPKTDGTLTIELEPASLGKLTIQVLYEAGRATVSILSSNPKTLELLSQKATELASILEEHTGQETVVYTEQPEADQPYDERGQEGQREGKEREQERKDQGDQEAFAQQLRLGLV